MLSDAFNCLGFTWASSPACTELEVIVMDWLGAALNLPPFFLNKPSNGRGGGVIQTTASDATFVALLCARTTAIRRVANEQQQMFKVWQVKQQQLQQPQKQQPETDKNKVKSAEHALEAIANHEEQTNAIDQTKSTDELNESNSESGSSSNDSGDESPPMEEDSEINSRLVAYCSDQAHSSVEKASLVALVKLRYIESDSQHSMDCERLEQTIRLDRQLGLIPFFICATLGTTGCCAFDHLETIGTIAARHSCYVHVDAAYAGAAMICEEYRSLMAGIHLVHSFAFNPSKWLQVHFDCTALWVRDVNALHRTFNVNPLYLKHEQTGCAIDFMHWQVALSRRFRSLKLWCVLRNFGLEGLKKHVRTGVKRAELFELLLRSDPRFSVAAKRVLGLVVFRLNAGNELTELLLKRLNSQGKIHCVPASLKGTYVIRFTVTSANTTDDDIRRDFKVIQAMTTQVLIEQGVEEEEEEIVQHDVAEELDRIDVTHLPKRIESPSALKAKETVRNPKLSQLASSFGTSLLLCNSPMTPKLVNGSFAAILDNQDVVQEFVRKFGANCNWQRTAQTSGSTALRRRIKGLMLSDKQYRYCSS